MTIFIDAHVFGECRRPLTRRDACRRRRIPRPPPLFPATTMDISFALTGKGYVIVAADTTAARSIVKMKVDEDKIKVLSPHLLMAFSGEPGMSYASHSPMRLL